MNPESEPTLEYLPPIMQEYIELYRRQMEEEEASRKIMLDEGMKPGVDVLEIVRKNGERVQEIFTRYEKAREELVAKYSSEPQQPEAAK